MALIKVDIEIDQGADFLHEWVWYQEDSLGVQTPVNLTGWTARMEVRASAKSATVLADAHTSPTTQDGTITVDSTGLVRLEFSAAASSAWSWETGVYDIELVNIPGPDTVVRFAEGNITLSPEVTRGA